LLWWRRGSGAWVVFAGGVVGAAIGSVGLALVLRLPRLVLTGLWSGFEVMAMGALGGMVLGVAATAWWRGEGTARLLDRLALPLGAMVAIARLGCFSAGCDFGRPSGLPWAVSFGAGSPAWHQHRRLGVIAADAASSAPVHPTQLYEAGLGLAMMVVAWRLRRVPRAGSQLVGTAVTYALGRGALEWLRADEGRGMVGGLSTPQWLCLAVLAAALWWVTASAPTVKEVTHRG
jgi:prolipoprotein diacylglyceryltransferase